MCDGVCRNRGCVVRLDYRILIYCYIDGAFCDNRSHADTLGTVAVSARRDISAGDAYRNSTNTVGFGFEDTGADARNTFGVNRTAADGNGNITQ